jgi:hypothetical protein
MCFLPKVFDSQANGRGFDDKRDHEDILRFQPPGIRLGAGVPTFDAEPMFFNRGGTP